jgi:hypothetical protein
VAQRGIERPTEDADTLTLYRPVGQAELDLIAGSDWCALSPRLPQQPIFYPVSTEEYATKIARDWNIIGDAASGYVGCVLCFDVLAAALERWPPQQGAAGEAFREVGVPAHELAEFNAVIRGRIEVVVEYRVSDAGGS